MNQLLDQGEAIEGRSGKYGATPLILAATNGQGEVVTLLLSLGADIEPGDQWGATALLEAAYSDHRNIVTLLLDRGADIEARDQAGSTALLWSAHCGHTDTVTLLLAQGASGEARTKGGWNPLHCAALGGRDRLGVSRHHRVTQGDRERVVQTLLHQGCQVNQVRGRAILPLTHSIYYRLPITGSGLR